MNKILIIILVLLLPVVAFSQKRSHHEAMQAEKVSYLTQQLELSVIEAQKFWPVYNAFQDELKEIALERRQLAAKTCIRHENDLSKKQIEENIDRMIELETLKAETEAKYHEKFKQVLPIEKVASLYHYEKEFRRHLLEKYRKHGRGGMHGGQGERAPAHMDCLAD
ncbi:MAG: hypothetical protein ACQES0_01430 [Bacteroidota bacterium]